MKNISHIILRLLLSVNFLLFTAEAFAEPRIVSTLLPTSSINIPEKEENDSLKISTDGNNKPTSEVLLTFDLNLIPSGSEIKKATLRLVAAENNGNNPQDVKIYTDSSEKESIGGWYIEKKDANKPLKAELIKLDTIIAAHNTDKKLSFRLSSTSRLSDWNYYSLKNYDNSSSFKPRLIIEYELPGIQESQTTERTNWKFHGPPEQVKVKQLLPDIHEIISNPVFYKNGMYLFTQTTSERTDLYALYTNGREMWKEQIKVKPASHAAVTDTGHLYSVGENRIVRYDLNNEGALIKYKEDAEYLEQDNLKLSEPFTLGRDGSLCFVRSGYGDLHGLNPNLEELWKYPSLSNQQGADKVSRLILSPDAQRYAYAMIRSGKNISGVRINTAVGEAILYKQYARIEPTDKTKSKQYKFGDRYTDFYRPVVVRGPEQDYVFLSAYSQNSGVLAAYSADEGIWSNSGRVSSSIADKNGDHVFVVQDGTLRAYKKFNGELVCASNDSNLVATSNLVMDGEDNVYFCNNGVFYGYKKDCSKFLEQLEKLPKELELMFAPDGTLYAFTAITKMQQGKQSLYSITPRLNAFTLRQEDVRPDTIYSADMIRVSKDLELDGRGKRIMLKAEKGIAIGTGFRVKKGVRLICKTGF